MGRSTEKCCCDVTHTKVLESLKTAINSTASSSGPEVQIVSLSFVLQTNTLGQEWGCHGLVTAKQMQSDSYDHAYTCWAAVKQVIGAESKEAKPAQSA